MSSLVAERTAGRARAAVPARPAPAQAVAVPPDSVDQARFRSVLSSYPTGVCAITTVSDGAPAGFVVGSFTSVSLKPALVGFFADRESTTFPKIRQAGIFCVNVLSARDEELCRSLAAKDADRFASVRWRPGPTGSPIIDGVAAWIDCTVDRIDEAGDHLLVLGRVVALEDGPAASPLVFHRGRFGSYDATATKKRQ